MYEKDFESFDIISYHDALLSFDKNTRHLSDKAETKTICLWWLTMTNCQTFIALILATDLF